MREWLRDRPKLAFKLLSTTWAGKCSDAVLNEARALYRDASGAAGARKSKHSTPA